MVENVYISFEFLKWIIESRLFYRPLHASSMIFFTSRCNFEVHGFDVVFDNIN